MADVPSKATTTNPVFTVLKQLKELWDNQPKGRRTLAVLILVGVIGFVGITTFLHKVESFTPVGEGMSPSDTQAVYTAVLTRGLNARLRDGKVEVEDSDLAQAKAIAAVSAGAAGLSSMEEQFGAGNHIGRSSFDEQVAFKMALEGELGRNIIALAQVSSANVHIAFGKRSPIKDMESAATASVTLVLRPGQLLTPEQVNGVRALVAASVDNLDAAKVVVIGPRGPMDGTEKAGTKGPQDLEARIAERSRSLIEKIVGIGHVSVVATAEMDTRKIESTEDLYDKDASALLSESVTVDGNDPMAGQGSVGGVAGAQGNLPGAAAPTSGSGAGSASGHKQQTRNFNNSHKQTHVENPEQTIKKLHVAVLVDEDKGKDGKSTPRSKAELDRITVLTHNAAGIDDARGDTLEVASVPFAPIDIPVEPEGPKPLLPVPMPVAIGAGAGLLVMLAIVVLLLKRRKKSKSQALVLKGGNRLSFPTPVTELERVLDTQPALGTKEVHGLPPGRTAQERVMDVVRSDVDRAAGVLTGWLAEAPALAKGATK